MGILDQVLGDKKDQLNDFVKKYTDGPPSEGYSDDEVRQNYGQVASRMSEQEYEEAARESFDRLSPQERREFGRQLRQRSAQQGIQLDGGDDESRYEDSGQLARMASRAQREKPDLLQSLLGGAGGSAIKGGLAGIAASAVKKFMK
jgi:hypothetical protein